MTESIFAPFRIESEESIRKLVKFLESEPTPWPEIDSTIHLLTPEEGEKFFAERDKRRAAKNGH